MAYNCTKLLRRDEAFTVQYRKSCTRKKKVTLKNIRLFLNEKALETDGYNRKSSEHAISICFSLSLSLSLSDYRLILFFRFVKPAANT